MFVIVSNIIPSEGMIEMVVISGDRLITACWLPRKYPERARIERIIKGKPLDRAQFIELALVIPTIVLPLIKGKNAKELNALIGSSYEVEFDLDFKHLTAGVQTTIEQEAKK